MRRLALALTLALCILAPAAEAAPARPNIVLVLADDLSWDLVAFMPEVQRMQREGVTFTDYFVTNSLCCPSRASILTGEFPHDTGVLNNTPPLGGFEAFRDGGAQDETFAVALKSSGYRTAYIGKYLNGYRAGSRVPPGWSNWAVMTGGAYDGFNYVMNVNGRRARYGARNRAYATDVLSRRGREFTTRVARQEKPFLLTLAPFAPHKPYTPAPRHAFEFPGLTAPRTPAFGARNEVPPAWLDRPPLTPDQVAAIDRDYRLRAQAVQAIDETIGALRGQLERRGVADETYLVFTSDNGYHLGEHRLLNGKMTAFDSDIRVPLIVVGPGIRPGSRIGALTANIDLAPTFLQLAGLPIPRRVDGQSLVPFLRGRRPARWRESVLVEHHGPFFELDDPDRQGAPSGNPPTYDALRTADGTYVRYETGEREYYDRRSDPWELKNVWQLLSEEEQAGLDDTVRRLVNCHDGRSCLRASER